MESESPIRSEVRRLLTLAWPVAVAQAATMLMGFVDLLMVGRLGADAMNAIGLANPWVFGTMFFAVGMISGIDPLVSQAHGAGDGERAARALQRGIIVALALSPALILLWTQTGAFLSLSGQDPGHAAAADTYVWVQVPSIPFFLLSAALRQYLQGRELVRPAMWVVGIANIFNVLFNWVLIFGNLGFPALGLEGAGIATALTRVLSFFALLAFVRSFRLHAGAWIPWSREILRWPGFRQLLGLGIFIAIQSSLEMWAFGASNLIAGRLGTHALAAHVIVMHMASFSFMFVLGVSQATTVRVGNLLGAGRPADAQRAGSIGIVLGGLVMGCFAAVFLIGRNVIPSIYVDDAAVVAVAVSIVPMAAAFQVFDGLQNTACGVLRGMGRPRPAVVANTIAYWVIALPLGYWLALQTDAGIQGLWSALTVGLVVVAIGLVFYLSRRGPATVQALAPQD
jgi:MATE family multidrug resistance protein